MYSVAFSAEAIKKKRKFFFIILLQENKYFSLLHVQSDEGKTV
jgi:hypothetical protein